MKEPVLLPRGNNVIVERLVTKTGPIIAPDNAKLDPVVSFIVVAKGPGKTIDGRLIPIDLEIGQEIGIVPRSALGLKECRSYGDRDLAVIDADYVLFVVNREGGMLAN